MSADLTIARPATIGAIREKHLALMQECSKRAEGLRAERAAALRLAIREAGADIEAPTERDEAQGIVDYWASSIASLPGQTYPELIVLDPYEGKLARAAGTSAAQCYGALEGEEERRIARQVFEVLLRKGANGVERCPPRERGLLRQNANTDDTARFDGVLAKFEATGAIVRLPGTDAESDRFQVADANIVGEWPELKAWLDQETGFYRNLADLLLAAERWQASGCDKVQLLRGKALERVDQFREETDLVDRFIDASKAAQAKETRWKWIVVGVALAFASAAAAFTAYQNIQLARERDSYQTENAELKALIAKAKADESVAEAAEKELPIDKRLEQAAIPPPASASTSALEQVTQLQGAIWLGSRDRQQVRPEKGGRVSDFARAGKGTRYRARADIYLRAGMPRSDSNYASQKPVGIVPKGALFELRGPARSYQRTTGEQFWAEVRVVPRVYIQHPGADPELVEGLRKYLAEEGFDVPQAELREEAKRKSEVRFFNAIDRSSANLLIQALRRGPVPALRNASCRSMTTSGISGDNFVLEVWFDPVPVKRTAITCPE